MTRYMDLIQHLVRDALVKDKVPVTRVLEIDVTAPVVIEV